VLTGSIKQIFNNKFTRFHGASNREQERIRKVRKTDKKIRKVRSGEKGEKEKEAKKRRNGT
jgi:hypothetical protein